MNNRRVGKFAVTAIVGLLSAIAGIASMEMINSLKKEIELGPTVVPRTMNIGKRYVFHDWNYRRT